MSDKGVSNERKKELEQMDPFQESMVKGLDWAAKHKKQLTLVIGAVVVVLVVFSAIMFSFKQSEIKSSQLVAAAAAKYQKVIGETRDPKKGFEAVEGDYKTVLDEYANTAAGRMALVTYGKICFDAREYDKAFSSYSKALTEMGNEAGMENFLLSALGNICQLKNEAEKAKSYYLRIEKGASGLLRDDARFALALIYESQNDMAASLDMYEKIAGSQNGSLYKSIAQAKVKGNQ